eukprot:TRINITY_DN30441_c0_g1_i1.p1 TRINITY_DN30441_c0_g1~~TRINITY_DN30441_c0_g1_i1.p1  ORF type:complete len:218 (-),score=31.97 TRINITY_DN30441_c0_g1_i1:274-900(-)
MEAVTATLTLTLFFVFFLVPRSHAGGLVTDTLLVIDSPATFWVAACAVDSYEVVTLLDVDSWLLSSWTPSEEGLSAWTDEPVISHAMGCSPEYAYEFALARMVNVGFHRLQSDDWVLIAEQPKATEAAPLFVAAADTDGLVLAFQSSADSVQVWAYDAFSSWELQLSLPVGYGIQQGQLAISMAISCYVFAMYNTASGLIDTFGGVQR